jgi:hypothetical protein
MAPELALTWSGMHAPAAAAWAAAHARRRRAYARWCAAVLEVNGVEERARLKEWYSAAVDHHGGLRGGQGVAAA